MEKKYYLVDAQALPPVFLKVIQAKHFLAEGTAKNTSVATRMAGISRSAFYKYKDKILDVDKRESSVTLNVSLQDEPGALQTLLSVISAAGSNIAFVSQVSSGNEQAMVSLVCRTTGMLKDMDAVIDEIKALPQVLGVTRTLRDLDDI